MKIALTTTGETLDSPLDLRFGRAFAYLIYDEEQKTSSVIRNVGAEAAQGAGIKAAETVVKAGATALITGDCGPKAFHVLTQAGVKIYSAKNMSVKSAIDAFQAGQLQEIASA